MLVCSSSEMPLAWNTSRGECLPLVNSSSWERPFWGQPRPPETFWRLFHLVTDETYTAILYNLRLFNIHQGQGSLNLQINIHHKSRFVFPSDEVKVPTYWWLSVFGCSSSCAWTWFNYHKWRGQYHLNSCTGLCWHALNLLKPQLCIHRLLHSICQSRPASQATMWSVDQPVI